MSSDTAEHLSLHSRDSLTLILLQGNVLRQQNHHGVFVNGNWGWGSILVDMMILIMKFISRVGNQVVLKVKKPPPATSTSLALLAVRYVKNTSCLLNQLDSFDES